MCQRRPRAGAPPRDGAVVSAAHRRYRAARQVTVPVEMGVSESMSEREIEDVLNSVRRLVAQAERRSRPAPLVLTPSMRVETPKGGQPDADVEPYESQPAKAVQLEETGPSEAPGPPDRSDPPEAADQPEAAYATGDEPRNEPGTYLPETRAPDADAPVLLDEQALQEMVTQIVRDELHGKLGERITLAVRKLVRNEIARALDEQQRK